MNTLGGNMLGLLREVRNFVLFRIHGCVGQRSLNENIIFCFKMPPQKFSLRDGARLYGATRGRGWDKKIFRARDRVRENYAG